MIKKNDNCCLFKKKENDNNYINTEEDKSEFYNIINEENDEKNNPLNLFRIIINDYINYPNYNLIETISNVENYISFVFNDYNQINLKYKFKEENIKDNSIELFGEQFTNNNKEKCFLLINEKIIELSRIIKLDQIFDSPEEKNNWSKELNVKLIMPKNKIMTDISYMFYGISTLGPDSNFEEFNTINIKKMSYLFSNCSTMKELPDISNFNTSNVTDMSYMFYNCSSLRELPDISKWKTKNIIDISSMFENCESLKFMPDISKWNIKSLKFKNNLFKNCQSLSKLPNLSKWNIDENSNMFEGCEAIQDISIKDNLIIKILSFINYSNSCLLKWIIMIIIFLFILEFLKQIGIVHNPIYQIYFSFSLENALPCIDNPIKYFNLTQYKCTIPYNGTNIIDKKNIPKDSKEFINKYINFSNFNKQIKLEVDIMHLKILNISHAIVYYLVFTIIIIKCLENKIKCNVNYINQNVIFVILLIYDIVSIISEVFNLIITERLSQSFLKFFIHIENMFEIKISEKKKKEISNFSSFEDSIELNILLSIIGILYTMCLCKKLIDIRINSIRYRNFFIENEK